MRVEPNVVELLADLRGVLDPLGVGWYVFGAQAVILYGVPRFSDDVDVTVELRGVTPKALVVALAKGGFALRIHSGIDAFVRQTRVLPLTHRGTGIDLDVVLAGPGLEQGILQRSEAVRLGRTRVPVVDVEDLLVLKILAGRGKDLDDVRGVLLVRGKTVDQGAVRDRLREMERALDRSDLVAAFDQIANIQKKSSGPKRRRRLRRRLPFATQRRASTTAQTGLR